MRPCPFCGSAKNFEQCREQGAVIRCDGCDAEGPWAPTETEAWRLWNARVPQLP